MEKIISPGCLLLGKKWSKSMCWAENCWTTKRPLKEGFWKVNFDQLITSNSFLWNTIPHILVSYWLRFQISLLQEKKAGTSLKTEYSSLFQNIFFKYQFRINTSKINSLNIECIFVGLWIIFYKFLFSLIQ